MIKKTFYHGSKNKYDILKPYAVNVGLRWEAPRWSIYMFLDKNIAYNWAIFKKIRDSIRVDWELKESKIIINNKDVDKLKTIVGQKTYLYELEVPIQDVGLGGCPAIHEFTVDYELKPSKVTEITITESILKNIIVVMTDDEIDQYFKRYQSDDDYKYNRGKIFKLIMDSEKDYKRYKITQKIKNGELEYGDDISGIDLDESLYIKDRRQSMLNEIESVLIKYKDINYSFFTEGQSLINIVDHKDELSEAVYNENKIISLEDILTEKSLTTEQKKKLKDSDFGLPESRSYPLIDKEHVNKAIQFFKYCPDEQKHELARNIQKRSNELHITINSPEVLKYINIDPEHLKEDVFLERSLTTEQKKKLKDSDFGLPESRSYPLIDKEHVNKAIKFFKYCPDEQKHELARNIQRHANKLHITINSPEVLKYINIDPEHLKEDMISMPIEAAMFLFEDYIINEGISLDKEGSILIRLREKTNFKEKYALSHKLIEFYMQHNNVEGVKYELCKIYYMITIIDKYYIHSPKSKLIDEERRQEAVAVKSFLVNDFNKGLKYILTEDNNFNFTTYFESTPYNKDLIKIETSHIEGLKKLIMAII